LLTNFCCLLLCRRGILLSARSTNTSTNKSTDVPPTNGRSNIHSDGDTIIGTDDSTNGRSNIRADGDTNYSTDRIAIIGTDGSTISSAIGSPNGCTISISDRNTDNPTGEFEVFLVVFL
jgi:hypothetical protein